MKKGTRENSNIICAHCADICIAPIKGYGNTFCCEGCKTVYSILKENDLTEYYELTDNPGFSIKKSDNDRYSFLKNESIANSIIHFRERDFARISFHIPNIHCSSCIWLLENLGRIHEGVLNVKVNFVKKEAVINFKPHLLSLHKLANLLDQLGYGPEINWESQNKKKSSKSSKELVIKLGVSAFAFGNIMLLSFPEYLGISGEMDLEFKNIFSFISYLLVLPVVFYCASDYYIAAITGLRNKYINIDVPIALGITTLFIRSSIDFLLYNNPGYLDSLSGLVFFLLIGKWFQSKTYENLSFERDYKSYFPLAVQKLVNNETITIPVGDLFPGDTIVVRNEEIIPADSVLLDGKTQIDYSFVTGESQPVEKLNGETIYAGGRQQGGEIRLKVLKDTSRSYLTGLWNNESFGKKSAKSQKIIDVVSQYFTAIILLIAAMSGAYWYFVDTPKTWEVIAAILIVACPCALALSVPFTYGNVVRLLGRNKLYLKSASVVETLSAIDTVVFDKTGTITLPEKGMVAYWGEPLTEYEKSAVYSMVSGSTHPLSTKLSNFISAGMSRTIPKSYHEIPGNGIIASFSGKEFRLGNADFAGAPKIKNTGKSIVYLSIDKYFKGYYSIDTKYVENLGSFIKSLSRIYRVAIISGDNNTEEGVLREILPENIPLYFNAGPSDKLEYIKSEKEKGNKVLMVGDGLNDGAALKESDLGIAVTGEKASFSPASDAIISIDRITQLEKYLQVGKYARNIVIASFIISFLYNIVGLSFAVAGLLSPVIAAIIMPLSSITVVAFTTLGVRFSGFKLKIL